MSLTKVTYAMIDGAYINALDFGMGTAATAAQNKTALLAAIASLGTTGGTIFIPRGTYSIEGDIAFTNTQSSICICGDAPAQAYGTMYPSTRLIFTTGTSGFDLTVYDPNGGSGNTIKDLQIDGSNVLTYGIRAKGRVYLHGVNVTNCTVGGAGIFLEDLINMTELVDVSCIGNNGIGLLVGKENGNNTIFSSKNLICRSNGTIGLKLVQATFASFFCTVLEANTEEGLYVYKYTTAGTGLNNVTFQNCWIENNNSSLAGGGYQMTVTSQAPDYAGNPASYIKFDTCHFNPFLASSQKALNIISGRVIEFINCQAQGDILLGAYSLGTAFYNQNGGTVIDNGISTTTGGINYGVPAGGGYVASKYSTPILNTTGVLQLQAHETGIVAYASGGLANATQLSSGKTTYRITTCATSGDSVKLPIPYVGSAATGQMIVIRNTGVASCNLFVAVNNDINFAGAGTPYALAPNTSAAFVAVEFVGGVGATWMSVSGT
jgi:hypothetical protein